MFKNNFSQKNSSSYQNGFTLIEIMIAMLIGVFLIAGVFQIFISTKQSYRMQKSLSRLQENGRFAMSFISKDLRKAGYRECITDSVISAAINGTNGASTGASTPDDPDTITITESISACGVASETRTTTYSIQIGESGEASLFKQEVTKTTSTTDELVEGVENLQILYGADTDGDKTPNYYIPAETPNLDMTEVVSIRVSLLLRSEEDIADDFLNYVYNGKTNIPTDRNIRRVFTSTLTARNRLP